MNISPLQHFIIPKQHKFPEFDDQIKRIEAAAIDMTDNLIFQAIIQAAKEAGVTDLYLIDKKFAADAIREKLEREDPKPLTIEELKQMQGEPVWVKPLNADAVKGKGQWCVIDFYKNSFDALIPGIDNTWYESEDYGKTWVAYRHKPKEDHHD